MKILLAPFNNAGQPIQVVNELKEMGVHAQLLQYGRQAHPFGYQSGKIVRLKPRMPKMFQTLRWAIEQNFDIYHFWFRSLFYYPSYLKLSGLDIPLIKARGKKIVYRFTGFDLRLRSEDIDKNPYSPFRYGFHPGYDEALQKQYLAFLQEYVDQFVVQDPEMQDFFPEAKIIPRVMNLDDWHSVGVRKTDCPLVVHAPSSKKVKGSEFVSAAVDELHKEGLTFRYKSITGMSHAEARQWYERADIIIDQLLIGWYGVLTLEGMALGKPVIVYVREELLEKFEHDLPIQNANPDTIRDSLRELIKDNDKRCELGKRSRKFVEEYHDVKKVAKQMLALYEDVLQKDPVHPTSCADIDYYEQQLNKMQINPNAWSISLGSHFARLKNSPFKKKQLMDLLKKYMSN